MNAVWRPLCQPKCLHLHSLLVTSVILVLFIYRGRCSPAVLIVFALLLAINSSSDLIIIMFLETFPSKKQKLRLSFFVCYHRCFHCFTSFSWSLCTANMAEAFKIRIKMQHARHGRRKHFFQGGATRGFFQNFSRGGGERGEISFFPLETKKTTFFCWNFQNPGGAGPPCSSFRGPWRQAPRRKKSHVCGGHKIKLLRVSCLNILSQQAQYPEDKCYICPSWRYAISAGLRGDATEAIASGPAPKETGMKILMKIFVSNKIFVWKIVVIPKRYKNATLFSDVVIGIINDFSASLTCCQFL